MLIKKGLEWRFIKVVSLVTCLYAGYTGYVAYKVEYSRVSNSALTLREHLVSIVITQSQIAVFAQNSDIADEIIVSLMASPYVVGVKISSFNGFERLKSPKRILPLNNTSWTKHSLIATVIV